MECFVSYKNLQFTKNKTKQKKVGNISAVLNNKDNQYGKPKLLPSCMSPQKDTPTRTRHLDKLTFLFLKIHIPSSLANSNPCEMAKE
jgi:hypothetical protein